MAVGGVKKLTPSGPLSLGVGAQKSKLIGFVCFPIAFEPEHSTRMSVCPQFSEFSCCC